MSKRKRKSVVVIGEGIPGTDLIRRYKVTGNQSIEIEPVYVAPLPRPRNLGERIIREAKRSGYNLVKFERGIVHTEPSRTCQDHPSDSGYRGVQISHTGRFKVVVANKYGGTFLNAKLAAHRADELAKQIYGPNRAVLNFPEHVA